MPRTARPSPDTLQLTVTSPPSAAESTVVLGTVPFLPWPLAGIAGGAVAAGAGWVLVVGVALVAWFTALTTPLPEVLAFSARLWLLGYGGGMQFGDATVTLVPLGLTVGGGMVTWVVGRFASGQAVLARPGMRSVAEKLRVAAAVAALVAAGYALVAAVMVLATGGPERDWTPVVGALALAAVCGAGGALRGLGLGLADLRPRWLAATLAGGLTGALGFVAVGALVVGVATLLGAEQVGLIEDGLELGTPGTVVWSVIALAYLPNAMLWGLSWAVGGGFTVGTGSLVSLSGTQVGMLPAIPLLGALPSVGAGSPAMSAWMLLGAVVGVVAGASAVRRLEGARTTTGSAVLAVVVAAAAGVVASALLVGAAWASRGNLGELRLVGLGPRLAELAAITMPLAGFCAVLGGVVCWALGAVRGARSSSIG